MILYLLSRLLEIYMIFIVLEAKDRYVIYAPDVNKPIINYYGMICTFLLFYALNTNIKLQNDEQTVDSLLVACLVILILLNIIRYIFSQNIIILFIIFFLLFCCIVITKLAIDIVIQIPFTFDIIYKAIIMLFLQICALHFGEYTIDEII
jgi:hypothetical protein